MNPPPRVTHPETIRELQEQLGRLFPEATVQAAIAEPPPCETQDLTRFEVLLGTTDEEHRIGCEIFLDREFDEQEVRFLRTFNKVFNGDLTLAPRLRRDDELWLSLQQTRFARVIARIAAFHTPMFLRCLRTIENALSLRYEAQPFATQLILTKRMEWIQENPSADFVAFPEPMSLTHAFFEEKWTRALAADRDLSLVGLGHDRGIVGTVYVDPSATREGPLIPPHSSLAGFCSVLVPGTVGLLASRYGDLRVLLPSGVTFMKRQGHWAMVNLRLLQTVLAKTLDQVLAVALTRLVADLSYEGHGALICCIEDSGSISEVVPDHSSEKRVGRSLRLMSRKLNVTYSAHQAILKRIATIDGAIVLERDGKILDVACMISDPPGARIEEASITQRSRFAGARSTAAWNASVYGLAIKVSEDGPITVFQKGRAIVQL